MKGAEKGLEGSKDKFQHGDHVGRGPHTGGLPSEGRRGPPFVLLGGRKEIHPDQGSANL